MKKIKIDTTRPGAPFINACFGNNNDNPTELTMEDFQAAIDSLIQNEQLPIDNSAEQRFGGFQMRDGYYAFVPESLIPIVKSMPGFIYCHEFPRQTYIRRGEIGCFLNARIIRCDDNAMIRDDQRSIGDNRIYWIDFCNDYEGHSLLRLRCTLNLNGEM